MTPAKIFIRYLERMQALLRKIEVSDKDVACDRLHPDMFPLLQQAKIAINFSLRCCCPLSNREIISFAEEELTFSAIFNEIKQSLEYLREISDEEFLHMDSTTINTTAGFADLTFSGTDYFLLYCVPNFMFHYCMVYAIARQAGATVGKSDFDGYHQYPLGFSFTEAWQLR